jgi:hypothetical protein
MSETGEEVLRIPPGVFIIGFRKYLQDLPIGLLVTAKPQWQALQLSLSAE